ncbi:MAG: ATPase [Pseudomonas sp.]|uniref:ATPase n=1 Tax=Pseudomonas sp. TaxID=306 RepID=UPI003D0A21BA
MRDDARDDFDNVPTLKAVERDDDEFAPPVHPRAVRRTAPKAPLTGPLWALLGASFIALGGVAWWSFQQISLMEQQLVATQESFARISEEAAGRLQVISGKVEATESTATDAELLKTQVQQLQASLTQQLKLQDGMAGKTGDLGKRLEEVVAQATQQQAANAQLQTQLQEQLQAQLKAVSDELAVLKAEQLDGSKIEARFTALSGGLAAVKAAQVDGAKIDGQLKSQSAEIAELKKQGNSAAIQRLEQDLLVLKSEQENRPAVAGVGASGGASTAEFDAFRGQMTRNITTLQSQVQNLQQQINARP